MWPFLFSPHTRQTLYEFVTMVRATDNLSYKSADRLLPFPFIYSWPQQGAWVVFPCFLTSHVIYHSHTELATNCFFVQCDTYLALTCIFPQQSELFHITWSLWSSSGPDVPLLSNTALSNKLVDLYPNLELNLAQIPQSKQPANQKSRKRVCWIKKTSIPNNDCWAPTKAIGVSLCVHRWPAVRRGSAEFVEILGIGATQWRLVLFIRIFLIAQNLTRPPANLSLTAVNSPYTKSVCHSHCSASQHHWWHLSWGSLNYYNHSESGEVPPSATIL